MSVPLCCECVRDGIFKQGVGALWSICAMTFISGKSLPDLTNTGVLPWIATKPKGRRLLHLRPYGWLVSEDQHMIRG